MPVQGTLNYKDGVYAIDAHTAEYDDPDKNVLTWMVSYSKPIHSAPVDGCASGNSS